MKNQPLLTYSVAALADSAIALIRTRFTMYWQYACLIFAVDQMLAHVNKGRDAT